MPYCPLLAIVSVATTELVDVSMTEMVPLFTV
jgi:hypothetical protein